MRRIAFVLAVVVALTSTPAAAQNCEVGVACGGACIAEGDVCFDQQPGTADNTTALIVVFSILGAIIVASVATLIAVQVWEANHLTWENEERERLEAEATAQAAIERETLVDDATGPVGAPPPEPEPL